MRLPALGVGFVLGIGSAALFILASSAFGMAPITGALEAAKAEAGGPILLAVSGILAVVVMIGVAAGVVRVVSRST